jgi:polyketide cyclase/dehydrase/lipid transport protein
MQDEVTVPMAASPDDVWELVSDVTRIGEFSPETFEAEWLGRARETGPQVGAKFRGHVKRNGRGPVYWTLCKVTAYEPGQEFAFAVMFRGLPVSTWGYRITPTPGGCEVTEYFRLSPLPPLRLYWAVMGRWRNRTNVEGMRQTLERIKAVVEAEPLAS